MERDFPGLQQLAYFVIFEGPGVKKMTRTAKEDENMVTVPNKPARLNKDALSKIQELEKETGTILVAYEKDSPYARLTEEQVERIRQLEKELGVILLAYKE